MPCGGCVTLGDEVLLLVGSDHGHETVSGIIDIEAELVGAGLKASPDSDDMVAVSSGTASLLYLHPDAEDRRASLHDFLCQTSAGWDRCSKLVVLQLSVRRRCITSRSLFRSPRMGRRTGTAFPATRWPPRRAGASRTGWGVGSMAASARSSSRPCC